MIEKWTLNNIKNVIDYYVRLYSQHTILQGSPGVGLYDPGGHTSHELDAILRSVPNMVSVLNVAIETIDAQQFMTITLIAT